MSLDLLQAYVEGLAFFSVSLKTLARTHPLCTTCGVCCVVPAWRPITLQDLERLCDALGVSPETFAARYAHPDEAGSLASPCPLLRRDGDRYLCSVYEARPEVCQAFNRCAPIQRDPPDAADLVTREQARFTDYFALVKDA